MQDDDENLANHPSSGAAVMKEIMNLIECIEGY